MSEVKTVTIKKMLIGLSTAVVFFAFVYTIFYTANMGTEPSITVGEKKINIELAQTDEEKYLGLSNRKSLGKDDGMLFVFDGYYIPSFVMRDMLFSIDIIWIKDNMVVGFEKKLPLQSPDEDLINYQPKSFVNYVLEVNSGFVEQNNIKIGDKVVFDF